MFGVGDHPTAFGLFFNFFKYSLAQIHTPVLFLPLHVCLMQGSQVCLEERVLTGGKELVDSPVQEVSKGSMEP